VRLRARPRARADAAHGGWAGAHDEVALLLTERPRRIVTSVTERNSLKPAEAR
jgi:hypothetical protein